MITAAIKTCFKYLDPTVITGPIFDKELRVSSRRKRNYVLRFFYLAGLIGAISMFWASIVSTGAFGSLALRASEMSVAAIIITRTIIWFQFIVTQLVAIAMLSTSISDEIYNKTLGVLMSTPINTFQIIMGKLLSKLLQLMLLIALSLPLLSVIRVFGGVPWEYIISSLCINFTAVLFAGSLAIYFSVSGTKSYEVILKTIFTLGLLYLFIPFVLGLGASGVIRYFRLDEELVIGLLYHTNPLATMVINTSMLLSPAGFPTNIPFFWPAQCLLLLLVSVLILTRSIAIVRKVALMQALGLSAADIRKERKIYKAKKSKKTKPKKTSRQDGIIRPVNRPPVIWKELRGPMIQGGKVQGILGVAVSFGALLFTYWLSIRDGSLSEDHVHTAYAVVFLILGVIMTMVLAATTITSEKESRTWPLLMATSIDDWDIVVGKTVGVLKRSIPIWIFLACHVTFFVMIGYIHPVVIVHLALIVFGIVLFLSGSGLYFSSLFKRTTPAVLTNLSLVLFLFVGVPILSGFFSGMANDESIFETTITAHPIVQSGVIMFGASGLQKSGLPLSMLEYAWPWDDRDGKTGFILTTAIVTLESLALAAMGFMFAWRAKLRFRKRIF